MTMGTGISDFHKMVIKVLTIFHKKKKTKQLFTTETINLQFQSA